MNAAKKYFDEAIDERFNKVIAETGERHTATVRSLLEDHLGKLATSRRNTESEDDDHDDDADDEGDYDRALPRKPRKKSIARSPCTIAVQVCRWF